MTWVSEGGVASVRFPWDFMHLTFSTSAVAGADILHLFASLCISERLYVLTTSVVGGGGGRGKGAGAGK